MGEKQFRAILCHAMLMLDRATCQEEQAISEEDWILLRRALLRGGAAIKIRHMAKKKERAT